MRIAFDGRLSDQPRIRAGFIGCGSHAFRNIYPTFQFTPVELAATCDLDLERAQAFARQFGAPHAYRDYREMLAKEKLDAVFMVLGKENGRPLYPKLAVACLEAGVHVWIEKPPATICAEVDAMASAARAAQRILMAGMKKMFFPANEKAKELIDDPAFGQVSLATLQYPQYVPTPQEFEGFLHRNEDNKVSGFLDHLCHPLSLLLYLLGMPESLWYDRAHNGAGVAHFRYADGRIATLSLTHGQGRDGGMERTQIFGTSGQHVVVENNLHVSLHKNAPVPEGQGYGRQPSYFSGAPGQATSSWEPEFSLGQLYNKGLFLLGYWGEVEEFARAILEKREPRNGTLEQVRQVTRIFEAFGEGPRKEIELQRVPAAAAR